MAAMVVNAGMAFMALMSSMAIAAIMAVVAVTTAMAGGGMREDGGGVQGEEREGMSG